MIMVIACMALTANAQEIATDKFTPQFGLIFKGTHDIGNGYTFTPKAFVMVCNGIQPWGYLSLSKGNFTATLGGVNNYRGKEAVGFAALKCKLPLGGGYTITHEAYTLGYDDDYFVWGCYDRTFSGEVDKTLGIYWELSGSDLARLQAGPCASIGNFELDILLGKTSSIRGNWTVPINL